ncbi:CsgG/HfaB family protein [Marispirochaeta aestuarii]|uniref:CsgG/HfaB family protein n=1 Tax=Marispirochaeta aestuarii TaxID=1963862 RepID=UPI002ABE0C15|nr:CsgG/HfaB family protein [Marispirochaeta aestuarii]
MFRKFIIMMLVMVSSILLYCDTYDTLVRDLCISGFQRTSTVAVAEMDTDGKPENGRFVADEITRAFIRAGIAVVERENIDRITEELEYQLSGAVDSETAVSIGNALGAEYLVFGSVRGFSRPGYTNRGMRILLQLVDVRQGNVIASASAEVEESDMTSPYQRREYSRKAEYPDFLEFKLGGSFQTVRYDDDFDHEDAESTDGPGFLAGISYLEGDEGFFTGGWEVLYNLQSQTDDPIHLTVHTFSLGQRFLMRLPLWRYFEVLPQLSHAYLGLAGAGELSVTEGEGDCYTSFGLRASALGGYSMGLGDSWNLFLEYRYSPRIASFGIYGIGSDQMDYPGLIRTQGHQVMAGIQLIP